VAGMEGGAWRTAKYAKNGEKGGGLAAPERASLYKVCFVTNKQHSSYKPFIWSGT